MKRAMLIASEHRRSKCGSRQEMLWGDGAAAVKLGRQQVVAEYLGAKTISTDFVDHYRGEEAGFDYQWEERWIRDEGYMKSVPLAVTALLEKTHVKAADIKHFILPSEQARTPAAVAKKLGIAAAVIDNQITNCGVTGAAHAMLLLTGVLEQAEPDELILLTGFGQGCDALLFRTTDVLVNKRPGAGLSSALAQGRSDENYNKFLSFNKLLERDIGKRGEVDKQTYLSALNRKKTC